MSLKLKNWHGELWYCIPSATSGVADELNEGMRPNSTGQCCCHSWQSTCEPVEFLIKATIRNIQNTAKRIILDANTIVSFWPSLESWPVKQAFLNQLFYFNLEMACTIFKKGESIQQDQVTKTWWPVVILVFKSHFELISSKIQCCKGKCTSTSKKVKVYLAKCMWYTDVLHGLFLYFLMGHCPFVARCSWTAFAVTPPASEAELANLLPSVFLLWDMKILWELAGTVFWCCQPMGLLTPWHTCYCL